MSGKTCRAKVDSQAYTKSRGKPSRRWIGLVRQCGLGDAGNVEPCSNKSCLLCSLLRGTVSREHYPGGILSTGSPDLYVCLERILPSPGIDSLTTVRWKHQIWERGSQRFCSWRM